MEPRYSLTCVDYSDLLADPGRYLGWRAGRGGPGDSLAPRSDGFERAVAAIIEDVRTGGEDALRALNERYDAYQGPLWYGPDDFRAARKRLDPADARAIESAAARVRAFAEAQLAALTPVSLAIPGGLAGHEIVPVANAGCYAPGGRFPLVSSALMTVAPARAAGARDVVLASPKPGDAMLAAAGIAGADALLAAGGAQAIAALAYGAGPMAARDVVVGPGNRFVTCAKELVRGACRCDAPAGPSEILVLADSGAVPALVAADLLAQAEHDPDARAWLAVAGPELLPAVEAALARGLADLERASPRCAENARAALAASWVCVAPGRDALARLADAVAPEHLALHVEEPGEMARACANAGAVFVGGAACEALGDYGAGPNHTLPTSGRARSSGGLSVFDFVRVRTWIRLDGNGAQDGMLRESARLARLEGLYAHEAALTVRLSAIGSP